MEMVSKELENIRNNLCKQKLRLKLFWRSSFQLVFVVRLRISQMNVHVCSMCMVFSDYELNLSSDFWLQQLQTIPMLLFQCFYFWVKMKQYQNRNDVILFPKGNLFLLTESQYYSQRHVKMKQKCGKVKLVILGYACYDILLQFDRNSINSNRFIKMIS